MVSEADRRFCDRLVEKSEGRLTLAEARSLIQRADAAERDAKQPVVIAEFVFRAAEGRVLPSTIAGIQAEMKRRIVICPHCPTKNNVWGKDKANPLRCPGCGQTFFFSEGLFPKGTPAEPTKIEGYRYGDLVQEGGQGAVYHGYRIGDDYHVAIKVVHWGWKADEAERARFGRECELAESLVHPNILRTLTHVVAPTTGVLVMEWAGRNLHEIVTQRGPLPTPEALRIAREMFAGLAYAHSKGIIHRDIKPANVAIGDDGITRILDFGLAKTMAQAGLSGITGSGENMGTLDYAPPEQHHQFRIMDERGDVYSAGATLYFLLAGHPPGTDRGQTTTRPIPEIVRLLEQLLAENPVDRPDTARVYARLVSLSPS